MYQEGFWRNSRSLSERYSELIGLKQNPSRWTRWRRKISPIAFRPKNMRDIRRPGLSLSTHLDAMHRGNSDQTSAKNSQRCTVFTVSLEKSDLHRFLSGSIRDGIRRLLHPARHGGSGMTTGGAHKIHQSQVPLSWWNERHHRTGRLVESAFSLSCPEWHFDKFLNCCSQIVYSCWQSAATDGGYEQHTSHVTFSRTCMHSF